MPRALAEKAKFFGDIQDFLLRQKATGAKLHEIYEHLLTVGWVNLQQHQVKHALEVMLKLHYPISRWTGDGRGHTWVNKTAQTEHNKKEVEPPPVVTEIAPGITVDLIKKTGRIRLRIDKFVIDIGIADE